MHIFTVPLFIILLTVKKTVFIVSLYLSTAELSVANFHSQYFFYSHITCFLFLAYRLAKVYKKHGIRKFSYV